MPHGLQELLDSEDHGAHGKFSSTVVLSCAHSETEQMTHLELDSIRPAESHETLTYRETRDGVNQDLLHLREGKRVAESEWLQLSVKTSLSLSKYLFRSRSFRSTMSWASRRHKRAKNP